MRCLAISRTVVLTAALGGAWASQAMPGEAPALHHPLTAEVPGWAMLRMAPAAEARAVSGAAKPVFSIGLPLDAAAQIQLWAEGELEPKGAGLRGILWLKLRF